MTNKSFKAYLRRTIAELSRALEKNPDITNYFAMSRILAHKAIRLRQEMK